MESTDLCREEAEALRTGDSGRPNVPAAPMKDIDSAYNLLYIADSGKRPTRRKAESG